MVVSGGTDARLLSEHQGESVRVLTGHTESMTYPAENVGTTVLAVTALGASELQTFVDHLWSVVLAVTAGSDSHINEKVGTVVLAVTAVTDLQTYNEHVGTTVLVLMGATVGVTLVEDVGTVVLVETVIETEHLIYTEDSGTVALVLTGGTDSQTKQEFQGVMVLVVTAGTDTTAALEHVGSVVLVVMDALGLHTVPVSLSLPADQPNMRRLSWPDHGQEAFVIMDGEVYQRTSAASVLLPEDLDIRQVLKVALGAGDLTTEILRQWGYSPLDRAELTWPAATGAVHYKVDRKTDPGAWAEIAGGVRGLSYVDGPLVDGTHSYRVWSVDEEDDVALSNAETVYVTSAPEPPSGIGYMWNPDTKTLDVTWSASPSSDIASYRVRSSAGAEALPLAATPAQDDGTLTWQKVFTTETGVWVVLVRAVDSDGNEEAHLRQAIALAFENGVLSALPAVPRLVEVEAVEDGKIEVRWLYDPYFEVNGPGGGVEARVYWDAGTGTMDWSAPYGVENMAGPSSATRYTWTSGPLAHGTTYRFAVRAATAAYPSGIETQNTDVHAATADTTVPAATVLSTRVI